MPIMQSGLQFLSSAFSASAGGLVGMPQALASDRAPETTSVRLLQDPGICLAPEYAAEELLRAEGFTDVRYIESPPMPIAWRRSYAARWISVRITPRNSSPRSMPAASNCSRAATSAASPN